MTAKFNQIERSLWDNPNFRVDLSRDERDLLLYLRTCPQHGILPGLFISTPLQFAAHLCWAEMVDGLQMVTKAFDGLIEKGWVDYDERTSVVFIRGIVGKFPPNNSQTLFGWKSAFDEIPDSRLKHTWLKDAEAAIESAYESGKRIRGNLRDNRTAVFSKIFMDDIIASNQNRVSIGGKTGADSDKSINQLKPNRVSSVNGFVNGSVNEVVNGLVNEPLTRISEEKTFTPSREQKKHEQNKHVANIANHREKLNRRDLVNGPVNGVVNQGLTDETLSIETETETETYIYERATNSENKDEYKTFGRPESSGYDRNKLPKKIIILGDVLVKAFDHVTEQQTDEWAYRLNQEFGGRLDLLKLFKEIAATANGNDRKVTPGKEWGHLRVWCRNALNNKEFAIDADKPGDEKTINKFKGKNGRKRFFGLFIQRGKTLAECIDIAANDGSATPDQVSQWREDLRDYDRETANVSK